MTTSRSTEAASVWLRRLHPADAAVRLVCLPHAGGSASFFYPLAQALAPHVQALGVQYPGRQDRHREPLVDDVRLLAGRIADVLAASPPGPFALLGHSMGAVVAYEVALRLRDAGARAPLRLFAAGSRAPSCPRDEGVHLRDDAGIVDELLGLGGAQFAALADPELRELVLPAVRGDYRAIERYRHRPGDVLGCPVTVLAGADDPDVSLDQAHDWRRHTTGPVDVRVFPGGHFFVVDHVAEVSALLTKELVAAPAVKDP